MTNQEQDTRPFVVVDIDGTMTIMGDRIKYIEGEKKDWPAFLEAASEDEPNWPIVRLVRTLSLNYRIVFCTARKEQYRGMTCTWLREKAFMQEHPLLMRPNDDSRSDALVKPDLLETYGITPDNTYLVLEDRDRLVRMFREMGFTCLQVANGDF